MAAGVQNTRHSIDRAPETFQVVAYEVSLKTTVYDHRCPMKQTTSASQVEVGEELNRKKYQSKF